MSIERSTNGFYQGEISFECDECGEELNTGRSDFRAALDSLKDAGWRIKRDKAGNYDHYCAGCTLTEHF